MKKSTRTPIRCDPRSRSLCGAKTCVIWMFTPSLILSFKFQPVRIPRSHGDLLDRQRLIKHQMAELKILPKPLQICCLQTMMNNLSPRFSTSIKMDFIFEAMQQLKLVVFDFDKTSKHDFLVSRGTVPRIFQSNLNPLFNECHCPFKGGLLHQRRAHYGHTGQFSN